MKQKVLLLLAMVALLTLLVPAETVAGGGTKTTVYFLRHAEDSIELIQTGGSGTGSDPYTYMQRFVGTTAVRPLNVLGLQRAGLLGEWFEEQGIAGMLEYVVATQKVRTQQTVQPIADEAGLAITQIPAGSEWAPSSISFAIAGQPTVDFVRNVPPGSDVVVANHSNNLYPMMQALGIDTSDPVKFPKDPSGFVVGYNNLWIVKIDASGVGELDDHVLLDLVIDAAGEGKGLYQVRGFGHGN